MAPDAPVTPTTILIILLFFFFSPFVPLFNNYFIIYFNLLLKEVKKIFKKSFLKKRTMINDTFFVEYDEGLKSLSEKEKREKIELISLEKTFLKKFSRELPHLTREERKNLALKFLLKEVKEDEKEEKKRRYLEEEEKIKGAVNFISSYGSIDPLIANKEIEEVMINGFKKPVLVYHRTRGKCRTNIKFRDREELSRLIKKIRVFSGVSRGEEIIDTILPEGSRVNLTLPPVSFNEVITIRNYIQKHFSIIELIKNRTLNIKIAAFLWMCVDGFGLAPRNILITGGTSSGKTTFLNALLPFSRNHERIVSIEETPELNLSYCEDWVRTKTTENIGMEKLVENSIRLRPDRIIVGEVRGREAYNLLAVMNLGHCGMGTLHANSARDAVRRLNAPPMNVPVKMLTVLDLIIVITRFYEKGVMRRVITHVGEVAGQINEEVQLGKIFEYNAKTKEIELSKHPATTIDKIAEISGLSSKDVLDEINKRASLLNYLVKKNISKQADVVEIIRRYYENPDKVLKPIGK
jgi:flagellar protein FlaI